MQPTTPASIALFDFSHAVSVAFHAAGPEETPGIVIAQLSSLRSSCERVILCLDSKPYRRNQVFEGYKAGRKQDPELSNIWDRTLARVLAEGYAAARSPGEEADDVMATLARIYSTEYGCGDVRLVTADKDIAQCLTDDAVRWFVPQLGQRDQFEIRTAQWVAAHFGGVDWAAEKKIGPTPAEIPLVQAICGDTSDKIPGVKGIGIKGAVGLVKTFGTPEGMANGLIAEQNNCKMKGKELPAFWRNFAAGMASIPKWLELTTLRTDVVLERDPVSYLDHVEPQKLVEEDDGFEIPDDDAWEPSEEELAEERAAMAAALPVDPAPLRTEPMPDPAERRAKMAAEADRVFPLQNYPNQQPPEARAATQALGEQLGKEAAARQTVPLPKGAPAAPPTTAAGSPAAGGAAHDPSKMVIGKDPKAYETLRDVLANNVMVPRSSVSTAAPTPPADSAPSAPTATKSEPAGTQPAPSGAGTSASPQPAATPNGDASSTSSRPSEPADPKAAPSTSAEASPGPAASPGTASSAHVVPPTQGPRKPREAAPVDLVAPPSWALATQPRSANEVFAISKSLHNSRRFLDKHPMPEMLAAVILRGRELGLGMMTSIDAFHVIRGKVCASSQLISALAERDPNHEYSMVVELDEEHAVVEIKHRKQPKPVRWSYTIEEANRVGLLAPSPKTGEPSMWVKRPKTMLAKTAQAIGHRFMFPSATLGLHALETEPEGQDHLDD